MFLNESNESLTYPIFLRSFKNNKFIVEFHNSPRRKREINGEILVPLRYFNFSLIRKTAWEAMHVSNKIQTK